MQNNNETPVKQVLSAPVLGQREIETLRMFWRNEKNELSASDILNMIKLETSEPNDIISINTVQSTIERLWKKKLLNRHKQGKAYIYKCMYSKQEVISSLIKEISDALGDDDDSAILSGISTFLKSRNTHSQLDLLAAIEGNNLLNTLTTNDV